MKRSIKSTFIITVIFAIFQTVVPAFAQTAPRFTSITTGPEGSISLTLTGAVLTSYTILATTDLKTEFLPLGVVVTDDNGTGTFTDPGTMVLNRQRFYRAQQTVGSSRPAPPANPPPQPRSQSANQTRTTAQLSRPAASR